MNENSQSDDSAPHAAPDASVPLGETITIFFSDIRGFTDYTEREGDETARQMLREYNAIVRDRIEAFSGKVVKELGDGFMAAFRASRPAILCAIAIQRTVSQVNRNQSGPRMGIGIGINTGEPIRQEDGDYIGGTVNLAARICAAAGPGQILVAESTRYVAGRIEHERSLKGCFCNAAEVSPCPHGANEHVRVEEMIGEADAIPEQRPLRERARGIDGDDADTRARSPHMSHERADQTRLADARRARHAD